MILRLLIDIADLKPDIVWLTSFVSYEISLFPLWKLLEFGLHISLLSPDWAAKQPQNLSGWPQMSIPCSRYRTVNEGWLQAVGWEQVHVSAHLGTQAEGAGPIWGMPFLRQRAQERKAWRKPAMPLESPGQEWWQDTSAHSLMPNLQDRIKPSPQGSKFFPRKCPAMNSASDFLQKFYTYKVICGQQSLLWTGRKWEDRGGVFLVAPENSGFEFCHSWVSKSFLCTPLPTTTEVILLSPHPTSHLLPPLHHSLFSLPPILLSSWNLGINILELEQEVGDLTEKD